MSGSPHCWATHESACSASSRLARCSVIFVRVTPLGRSGETRNIRCTSACVWVLCVFCVFLNIGCVLAHFCCLFAAYNLQPVRTLFAAYSQLGCSIFCSIFCGLPQMFLQPFCNLFAAFLHPICKLFAAFAQPFLQRICSLKQPTFNVFTAYLQPICTYL